MQTRAPGIGFVKDAGVTRSPLSPVSGTKKRVDDVVAPRTIHDIPEHVLTCGLTLPGLTFIDFGSTDFGLPDFLWTLDVWILDFGVEMRRLLIRGSKIHGSWTLGLRTRGPQLGHVPLEAWNENCNSHMDEYGRDPRSLHGHVRYTELLRDYGYHLADWIERISHARTSPADSRPHWRVWLTKPYIPTEYFWVIVFYNTASSPTGVLEESQKRDGMRPSAENSPTPLLADQKQRQADELFSTRPANEHDPPAASRGTTPGPFHRSIVPPASPSHPLVRCLTGNGPGETSLVAISLFPAGPRSGTAVCRPTSEILSPLSRPLFSYRFAPLPPRLDHLAPFCSGCFHSAPPDCWAPSVVTSDSVIPGFSLVSPPEISGSLPLGGRVLSTFQTKRRRISVNFEAIVYLSEAPTTFAHPGSAFGCGFRYKAVAKRAVLPATFGFTMLLIHGVSSTAMGSGVSSDIASNGFTLLVRGHAPECLEFLDKVLTVVQGRVNVSHALLLQSSVTEDSIESQLPLSRVKTTVVDEGALREHIPRREQSHDQAQWIAFYKVTLAYLSFISRSLGFPGSREVPCKQTISPNTPILLQDYDVLMTEWQSAGRRLALEMSELKECSSLSGTLTPLGRLLTDPTLRRTSRDAEEAIASLEERAAPLLHLEHVRLESSVRNLAAGQTMDTESLAHCRPSIVQRLSLSLSLSLSLYPT
ncbi:hypothetical protein WN48_08636 [Eufriesea mexicana]|nr:hypothetical protein WN48_08636 [Eufriesea mexicana]